jgi:hypothetical protein
MTSLVLCDVIIGSDCVAVVPCDCARLGEERVMAATQLSVVVFPLFLVEVSGLALALLYHHKMSVT